MMIMYELYYRSNNTAISFLQLQFEQIRKGSGRVVHPCLPFNKNGTAFFPQQGSL